MDVKNRRKLQKAGWKIGDAEDFLDLSPEERAFVQMKLALARGLRETRTERDLSQTEVAALIGSSQSRVAKMEAADPSVSLDLMIKALLSLGAQRKDVAKIIAATQAVVTV